MFNEFESDLLEIFMHVFDDDGGDDGGDTGGDDGGDTGGDTGGDDRKFTQQQMDAAVQKAKSKQKATFDKRITSLNKMIKDGNLNAEQVSELRDQIEDMENEFKSKEELARDREQAAIKKHQKEIGTMTEERDVWKNRYTRSTINNSLTHAAVSNNALFPEQLTDILGSKTALVDEVAEDGTKTGNLIPETTIKLIIDGKEETVKGSPAEVVKKMASSDRYFNLFKSDKSPGMNRQQLQKPGGSGKMSKNTAEYLAQRKESGRGRGRK